ncbi:hypothetical protein H4R20_000226 [Coemansia guatemalensis]|uniref:Large ribosomal subunit protein bL28m n=1 Tax=Coemansia guatemalensis TaxID=2761395 RepID=A0A9W8I4C5_9FUNG|nr:hypothetical protein H4R20_000226 [Coemansia guatemalensis]
MLTTTWTKIVRGSAPQFYRLRMDGLFGGVAIQHGNNKPKSLHKTRRIWLPNIQKVKLYSAILDRMLEVNLTTRVLRTIDKKGGIDRYILDSKEKHIASDFGLSLKKRLLRALDKKKSAPQQDA